MTPKERARRVRQLQAQVGRIKAKKLAIIAAAERRAAAEVHRVDLQLERLDMHAGRLLDRLERLIER